MIRRLLPLVVGALVAAPVALADGGPAPTAAYGVLGPGGKIRFATLLSGRHTTVNASRTNGVVLRWRDVRGRWGVPGVASDGTDGAGADAKRVPRREDARSRSAPAGAPEGQLLLRRPLARRLAALPDPARLAPEPESLRRPRLRPRPEPAPARAHRRPDAARLGHGRLAARTRDERRRPLGLHPVQPSRRLSVRPRARHRPRRR